VSELYPGTIPMVLRQFKCAACGKQKELLVKPGTAEGLVCDECFHLGVAWAAKKAVKEREDGQ